MIAAVFVEFSVLHLQRLKTAAESCTQERLLPVEWKLDTCRNTNFVLSCFVLGLPLWSSSESSWLLTQRVWNGVHLALVRVNEELLERKVAAPV
jgi:hypothetical protein